MKKRAIIAFCACASVALFFFLPVASGAEKVQIQYPTRPIQIIVPAKPGGVTDTSARLIEAKLGKLLGQPFVVVNIEGAGGSIASRRVKDSKNDGYTVLWQHNGLLVNNVMNVVDYSYEAFENGPILVKDNSNGFFSNVKGKYKDFATLIREAKKRPNTITYGAEFGGLTHLQAVAFMEALGVTFNVVDVGSDALKREALLGEQIDIAPGLYTTYKAQLDAKEFNYLCVLPRERNKFVPQVQTVKELGYNFSFDGYTFGFHFPKNTPANVLAIFSNACERLSKDKKFNEELNKKFLMVSYIKPDNATAYWKNLQNYYNTFRGKLGARKKN